MLEKVKYLILKGLGLGLTLVLVQSCISNKRITYLQNLPGNVEIGLDEYIPYAEVDYKYVLQPFDIVSIDFASSNEDLIKAFEYQGSRSMRGGGGGGGGASDIFYFTGYSIDQEGYIELPQLGKILIGGMVEEEAQNKVQAAINEFFKEEVFVKLRIGGIRFTALGEFSNSGTQIILKNRATIFDALAIAGESNILAKKNKLFIIRQYDKGTKIHQINLNDRQILASPYYFIQPNDILYLEPMKIRQFGNADNLTSSLGLIISVTSSVFLIIALVTGNL
ncbi:polysaccharide biosynthesis/export family protein [Algoriphagus boritolerans]|uniref:Polysaccharide export outer membrane protein n=1 Tax=Algoriphagus boritolerans DSM 17298 = JCM 18970 TaxID=1120964 RepID=A0A1H5XF60_9BACT|nr:polysaccharide biosynthesis/export family protein [Algoriphagus boritolerans]SEG10339.1 polysaccharide export outer membrane protein [Algoriphagus boritolerans DSM 17298 = JCM 18970]